MPSFNLEVGNSLKTTKRLTETTNAAVSWEASTFIKEITRISNSVVLDVVISTQIKVTQR